MENLSAKGILLEQKRKEVDSFVTIDELPGGTERRRGVDPELREMLALILALGMHPDQSCWGHPEKFSQNDNIKLTPEIHLTGGLPDHEYTDEEVERASLKAKKQVTELRELLTEFYRDRKTLDEAKIIVDYIDDMPAFKICSAAGRETLAAHAPSWRSNCIEASRKEWRDFEAFLKKHYFQS